MADESFAARERAMLLRLEVGLADEGVRVVYAVPRSAMHWRGAGLSAQTVPYESRGLSVSRAWRVRRLVEAARALQSSDEQAFDLVHAFGEGCWTFAAETARQTGAALALEVHSAQAAMTAARRRPGAGATLYLLPDAALERPVRAGEPGVQARLTPWGVHTPGPPREGVRRGPAVVIDGGGADRPAMRATLEGLAAVAAQQPDLMIFADEGAAQGSGAWGAAQRLKLTDRFTLAPDIEARRELALRGDILVIPEARGEHRSLTLDAMAAGMLVIAAEDPFVSVLSDGRTARLVRRPTAEAWRETFEWAIREPAAARALALSGREHVRLHCRASAHVAAVLGAYEWMTSGASIPFEERV